MKHRFQTPFTVTDEWSGLFSSENNEPSLTQQSDAAESDINIIMKQYGQSGMFPQVTTAPSYGDFSGVTDYRSALELVQRADQAFQEVPASTRKLFNNDPASYLEFVQNPENKDKIKELGLANAEKIPETTLSDIAKILKEKNESANNNSGPASGQSASGA